MNNIEHCPDELFDWIGRKDYKALTAEQKAVADRFFSAEDYDAMHVAAQAVKQNPLREQDRKESIRTNLLNRFDEKYAQRNRTIALFSTAWKAAAAILVVGLPLSAYWLVKHNADATGSRLSEKIDTVYIRQDVEKPVKVYDTVYIEKEEKARPVRHRQEAVEQVLPASEQSVSEPLYGGRGLNTQSIERLNALPNTPKRNTIKDDSLLQHYGFVTL